MANKIYLEYRSISSDAKGTTAQVLNSVAPTVIEAPLISDVVIEANSEWMQLSSFVPAFVSNILNVMNAFSSAGGSVSQSFANFMNSLEMPMWKSTPPAKIQLQLGFFTKTDSLTDVFVPTVDLVGLSILSVDPDNNNKFILPGMNLKNMRKFTSSTGGSNISRKSKLVSFEIPGIIYLPLALVYTAIPTFSKELTESSFPLWSTIDVTIMGVQSGSTNMFTEAYSSTKRWENESNFYAKRIKSYFE